MDDDGERACNALNLQGIDKSTNWTNVFSSFVESVLRVNSTLKVSCISDRLNGWNNTSEYVF